MATETETKESKVLVSCGEFSTSRQHFDRDDSKKVFLAVLNGVLEAATKGKQDQIVVVFEGISSDVFVYVTENVKAICDSGYEVSSEEDSCCIIINSKNGDWRKLVATIPR